jgi:hypothetical protein
MTFDLPKRSEDEDFTPPPLRFGWRYHYGMRAVYAGGVAMPLERALGHYEKSHGRTLALPAVTEPGRTYRRHERIDAPLITVPDWAYGDPVAVNGSKPGAKTVALPGRSAAEQTLRMIVRTVEDPDNRGILGMPRPVAARDGETVRERGIARRVLIPPAVSLDFASLHGVFNPERTESAILFEPRIRENDKEPLRPGEAAASEFVLTAVEAPDDKPPAHRWQEKHVAWQQLLVATRPTGGLKGVDYRAVWGGFPVFRMKKAGSEAPPPAPGKNAVDVVGEVTDIGEVVDGGGVAHKLHFASWPKGGVAHATVEWNAIAGVPSGAAVFRPLSPERAKTPERLPYYPDPGALHLVFRVAIKDGESKCLVVPLYREGEAMPTPPGYPDAMPVVLDVVRQRGKTRNLINFADGEAGAIWTYSERAELSRYASVPAAAARPYAPQGSRPLPPPRPAPSGIPVRHVVVTLAPGEEARIEGWCLPGSAFLRFIFEGTESVAALSVACGCVTPAALRSPPEADAACRAGFAALGGGTLPAPSGATGPCAQGVGGLHLPTQGQIDEIAERIAAFMREAPLPEIAATVEIEAVHAVDLPQAAPTFVPSSSAVASFEPLALLRIPHKDADLLKRLLAKEASGERLRDPRNWNLESHFPDAVDVLLAGTVDVHAPSTSAVEIQARGAAAARGRFDDPQRGRTADDRARGLWPKPDDVHDAKPRDLFGFTPSADGRVKLDQDTVTLLRIDGISPGENRIDLLAMQRRAADTDKAGTLRALRPAAFPDGCARHLTVSAVAVARHTGVLRTRYDELPVNLTRNSPPPPAPARPYEKPDDKTPRTRLWLPATARPARIAPLSLIPSFVWKTPPLSKGETGIERRMCVRVRAQRPWFSSGEGERFGVVLWPPNLFELSAQDVQQDVIREFAPGSRPFNLTQLPDDGGSIRDLQDADLGPGGAWVTRWGADPIRPGRLPQGWLLSADNFKDVRTASPEEWERPPEQAPPDGTIVSHTLMPVPAGEDVKESRETDPRGGFHVGRTRHLRAALRPGTGALVRRHRSRPLDVVSPFVRMGLVRYQPHAPARLSVSEPIVEWVQLLPRRTVTASKSEQKGMTTLTVKACGLASERGNHDAAPEVSSAQRPPIRMTLLRRTTHADGDVSETVSATCEPTAAVAGEALQWEGVFRLKTADFSATRTSWSVYVEEVECMRPATYPDEPRPATQRDALFAETGPRFAARLELRGWRE